MTPKYRMNRRRFLKTSMTGLVGTGIVSGSEFHRPKQETQDEKMKIKEYRTLGRTGFKVSDIGFGAGYLTNANASRCHNCAGHCVAACPYNIPIQSLLVLAHQNLTLA